MQFFVGKSLYVISLFICVSISIGNSPFNTNNNYDGAQDGSFTAEFPFPMP